MRVWISGAFSIAVVALSSCGQLPTDNSASPLELRADPVRVMEEGQDGLAEVVAVLWVRNTSETAVGLTWDGCGPLHLTVYPDVGRSDSSVWHYPRSMSGFCVLSAHGFTLQAGEEYSFSVRIPVKRIRLPDRSERRYYFTITPAFSAPGLRNLEIAAGSALLTP